jgi:hypothetical protein
MPRSEGGVLLECSGVAMWMAEQMEGEVVGELPTYAPAFKEVYRYILKALGGDVFAATNLFQKYLAGEMPERLLSISRRWVQAEQAGADDGGHPSPTALAA